MTTLRRYAKVLLAVYSGLLAVALFSPSSSPQSAAITWLSHVLVSAGLPATWVTFDRLEVVMNAAIIAPVTFLGGLLLPRWGWRDWTGAGFVAAVVVEVAQGVMLPGRQAAFSDVVANTAGACTGALLFSMIRPMLRTKRLV